MLVSSLSPTITTTTSSEVATTTTEVGHNNNNNNSNKQNDSMQDDEGVFIAESHQTNNNNTIATILPTPPNLTIETTKDDPKNEQIMHIEWDDHREINVEERIDSHLYHSSPGIRPEYEQQRYNPPSRRRQRCESMHIVTNNHPVASHSITTPNSGLDEFDACAALTSLRRDVPVIEREPRRRSMSVNDAGDWTSQQQNGALTTRKSTNINDVMGKAKRAASTLWLLLHAQTCSLADQCPHVGCREAKSIHLHLATCQASQSPTSSNTNSSCPTNHHGCDQARKLLSHYRKCRIARIAKARNVGVAGVNTSSSQQQRHSCLICSLVARQAKAMLDVTSKNENLSPPSILGIHNHISSSKGLSTKFKKKTLTLGSAGNHNSDYGTVSFVHDPSLLSTGDVMKKESKNHSITNSGNSFDTTIITKSTADRDDPTTSMMMPPPPPRKSAAVGIMRPGSGQTSKVTSSISEVSALILKNPCNAGSNHQHFPMPAGLSSDQHHNKLALLSATAIEVASIHEEMNDIETNDEMMESSSSLSVESNTIQRLPLQRRRSNSQPTESSASSSSYSSLQLQSSEHKPWNSVINNSSAYEHDDRFHRYDDDDHMISEVRANHECIGEQLQHGEEHSSPRRLRAASLGGLPLISLGGNFRMNNDGSDGTNGSHDCIVGKIPPNMTANVTESCSLLLMLSAHQNLSQLPVIGEDDLTSVHTSNTSSSNDDNSMTNETRYTSEEATTMEH